MNKKLIALATACACAAPAAMAQTANPVTLYGRVIVSFEQVEAKGAAPKRTRVQDNSSFLGVRGTEDLGGGLKAFFQLETAFAADNAPTVTALGGGTGFANRNSGIGLQGGWGSFLMGRWDAPFKVVHYAVDAYSDVTIGGITGVGNDQGNFDRRPGNMLQYWSPNWGGFAFRAMYQTEEAKTATATPQDQSYSLTFNRGPVYLFGAWEEHKDQAGTTATGGAKDEGLSLGGTFAFGPVRVGGVWQEFKKTGRTKKNGFLANAIWTVGNNQFIYQFQQSEDGGLNNAAQPECDSNAVTWRYNFSKRTIVDLTYVKIDNNATANCGNSGGTFGAIGVTPGSDPQGISFGMRHVF